MKKHLLKYKGKRSNNSKDELLKEIIEYIREEYPQNHIPSKRELQNLFHLGLDKKISEIYNLAGLEYKSAANQEIKSDKSNFLVKIIIENLHKLDLKIIKARTVRERGVDILARNENEIVGLEIKAYNKFERLKKENVEQGMRFLKKENLDRLIIITTSDLSEKLILPNKITVINYKDLLKIIDKEKYIEELNFIRNKSINQNNIKKTIIKQSIVNYINKEYHENNRKPTFLDVQKEFKINLYTYFDSLFEIYKICKIAPPLKNMGGLRAKKPDKESMGLWKDEFKNFILEEIKKGKKYPTGADIGKRFEISHIWNIVKVSELYKELGLKPYLERKNRSKTTFSQVY